MIRRSAALLFVSLWCSACGASPQAQPTALEGATVASLTPTAASTLEESTATLGPLTEATLPIVLEPPDLPPTPTIIPPPVNLPPENLSILEPGPGSQVTSPFQMIGRGGPSFNERVEVRLIGEDGRLIDERTTILLAYPGGAGRFITELSFESPLVAELARLEIVTFERRYGRVGHLASMNLVLLSTGRALVHPGALGPEKIAILAPRNGSAISGGRLTVQGAGWLNADVPLTVELFDSQGQVLASAQVQLDAPGIGQVGIFRVELTYQIPFRQYGRIAVSEPSMEIPGLVHSSSVEVFLQP